MRILLLVALTWTLLSVVCGSLWAGLGLGRAHVLSGPAPLCRIGDRRGTAGLLRYDGPDRRAVA